MFNILISQSGEQESFKLFSFLWLLAIVLMILYEIVRQMGSLEYRNRKKNKALARINTIFNALCQKENILKDDERSISEIFSNKGIKKGSSSDNDLNLLIGHLREMYVGYLGTQGVPEKKAHETATGIISDKASSKAIGGIINVLGAANVIPNDRDFASD
jgi:hypothetical protein